MDDTQNLPSEELAGDVMESLGEPETAGNDAVEASNQQTETQDEMPLFAKEKIGKLQKRYDRDMRRMQEQISQLHARMGSPENPAQQQNQYTEAQEAPGVDEQIQKAVNYALSVKENQERAVKESESKKHIQKQYDTLQDRLNMGAQKYDDFDDVVLADHLPYTKTMRDAALLIANPEEVLYKLGKDPEQLKRISALHPLDQTREMVKLSIALMGGNGDANKSTSASRPLSQIKSSPSTSQGITEKSSVSDIRKKMRSNWK